MITGICILAGYILDLIFGDPYWLPHPIRLMGKEITLLEKFLYPGADSKKKKMIRGAILVILVIGSTAIISALLLYVSFQIHFRFGILVECLFCYQVLAAKCLKTESMKVYKALQKNELEQARYAVSMIVGRDTAVLNEEGMIKAAVETVAENTSDGVIAPLFYLLLAGPIGAFIYKAINTMDSMIGYKNERYLYFGRFAAKVDDVVNYIPSRISAYMMILAAFLGGFDGKNAYRIYKRDKGAHASPNSAQTESVCAGALQIRLAGDAVYFGKLVKKPYIGDAIRPVCREDIKKANKLLYLTTFLSLLLGLSIRMMIWYVGKKVLFAW